MDPDKKHQGGTPLVLEV